MDADDLNVSTIDTMDFRYSGLSISTSFDFAHRYMLKLSEGRDILSRRDRRRLSEHGYQLFARIR